MHVSVCVRVRARIVTATHYFIGGIGLYIYMIGFVCSEMIYHCVNFNSRGGGGAGGPLEELSSHIS